ncbi:MAG: phosphoribosylaminoimidazolesuccinocarboxamide synthase [Candidatus Celaenobacter antarcticus]|nr:phosphoribosylaminoimidazolesuccinocarboxamide synthase [Candidatus Celaenobacter antarcticus]MDP8315078.1 phosphoribosylaminoimidazolesuccinocarboxamide synthase [Candidatus Celaenobacter antarcticus]
MVRLRDRFPLKQGKVRDIYDLGNELLIIASDRISAFDYILPDEIPDKGKILNQIAAYWFDRTASIIPNHLISTEVKDFPGNLQDVSDDIEKRSMLVRKANKFPIECIVRGYIAGSGWKNYKKTGTICGIKLPEGLVESEKLPESLFTPSTKAENGHDENISFEEMARLVDPISAEKIKEVSLRLYSFAHDILMEKKGIILADTKFEFGLYNNEIILIDEIFTPDSSRFWDNEGFEPGKSQTSFDKQFVRDYLISKGIQHKENIAEDDEILRLPEYIIQKTREKYSQAYTKITGKLSI